MADARKRNQVARPMTGRNALFLRKDQMRRTEGGEAGGEYWTATGTSEIRETFSINDTLKLGKTKIGWRLREDCSTKTVRWSKTGFTTGLLCLAQKGQVSFCKGETRLMVSDTALQSQGVVTANTPTARTKHRICAQSLFMTSSLFQLLLYSTYETPESSPVPQTIFIRRIQR